MLSILAWWAIPVGAVVLAVAGSALARRVRRASDDDTIHAYRRFREAISNGDPIDGDEAGQAGDGLEASDDRAQGAEAAVAAEAAAVPEAAPPA